MQELASRAEHLMRLRSRRFLSEEEYSRRFDELRKEYGLSPLARRSAFRDSDIDDEKHSFEKPGRAPLGGAIKFLLTLTILPVLWGAAGEMQAGSLRVPVIDTIAVGHTFIGNKLCLDVFCFARILNQAEKDALAAGPVDDLMFGSVRERTGATPIANLMFFFNANRGSCRLQNLAGYTAAFQKSQEFPAALATNSLLNLSVSGGNYRILALSCGFQTGAPVRIRVRHTWTVDRKSFPTALPTGRDSLPFTWDLDFTGTILKGMD